MEVLVQLYPTCKFPDIMIISDVNILLAGIVISPSYIHATKSTVKEENQNKVA